MAYEDDTEGGKDAGGGGDNITRWKRLEELPPVPNVNFASLLLNIMKVYGDRTALTDSSTGRCYSYSDIVREVPRVCRRLCGGGSAGGVAECGGVLLVCSNNIDYPIILLSILLVPAACAPINPSTAKPEDIAHAVRVSGARWYVVEEGMEGVVEAAASLLPPNTFRRIWTIRKDNNKQQQQQQYEYLIGPEDAAEGGEMRAKSDADYDYSKTLALMLFSSGTTGLPKGVMLSHSSLSTIVMQSRCIRSSEEVDVSHVFARTLLILPLQHIYAIQFMITTLLSGNQLIILDRFSPRSFLQSIEKYKITFTPIVPHIINYLLHSPLVQQYDTSSLFALGCGSAPLSQQDAEGLVDKIGVGVGNGYGLTESCGSVSANNTRLGFKAGSVGRPLPYREVKIVKIGDKTNQPLPVGEEGEVMVGGVGLMLGYSSPSSTPTTTPAGGPPVSVEGEGVEGGWIRTGDIGYVDEDGFLFLTDRLKDVIKVKGMQVYPREIERVLREVEGVGEAAVIGVPSPRLGEAPRGYVIPSNPANPPAPRKLMEYVKERLPSHKHLSGGLEIVEALPKNALGKVRKRDLKNEFIRRMNKTTTTTTIAATTSKKTSKL